MYPSFKSLEGLVIFYFYQVMLRDNTTQNMESQEVKQHLLKKLMRSKNKGKIFFLNQLLKLLSIEMLL